MLYEIRYAKSMLDRWGAYMERVIADQHGLPKAYGYLTGSGTGQPGHRILCMDPPRKIWVIGYLVSQLPLGEREAIEAWHIFRLKPNNVEWETAEKAAILGINYATFRSRVNRGTRQIAKRLYEPLT